jgi:DNA-binding MarR family transcriptional regulator
VSGGLPSKPAGEDDTAGPEQRPAGLGGALLRAWVGYRSRLDEELAAAGFDDRGVPDGRVLRICRRSAETTISQIGRELGITRQGAGKIVASLRDRGYVTVSASTTDGREKVVTLTPRATDYLTAHRKAARRVERQVRAELGEDSLDSLYRLLTVLGADSTERVSDYVRRTTDVSLLVNPEH